MIAALLCGLAFGALAVWERWARAERERRADEVLETLPSDEDDWPDPPFDAYEDWGTPTAESPVVELLPRSDSRSYDTLVWGPYNERGDTGDRP